MREYVAPCVVGIRFNDIARRINQRLNCIDWARHRRKKAAAKLQLNLDVDSRLPTFAVVEDAVHHDSVHTEVDGKTRELAFLTDNPDWSTRTVAELYKARWAVELFFKELKQICQIHDFVGYNENTVRWQVWTGLLVHLLLHFMRHVAGWALSFSRLAGVARAALWVKRELVGILRTPSNFA